MRLSLESEFFYVDFRRTRVIDKVVGGGQACHWIPFISWTTLSVGIACETLKVQWVNFVHLQLKVRLQVKEADAYCIRNTNHRSPIRVSHPSLSPIVDEIYDRGEGWVLKFFDSR